MTYTYIASTNTLKQVPTMEKPGMPHGAVHLSTAYAWERASANYQEHLASLKEISCEPECKEVWKDGDTVIEGKDFRVLGAGDWKWCTELKGNVFASPIKVASEDDLMERWKRFVEDSRQGFAYLMPGRPLTLKDWHKVYDNAAFDFIEELKQKYTITKK
jgi:hypothetical protein